MDISTWQSQLRKGAAELVVLAVLSRREAYGLEILEGTKAAGDLLAEGALYQLLNRLEREGKLASRWDMDGETRHPRKYYALTSQGRKLFTQMREAWAEFDEAMNTIMEKSR